MKPGDCIAFPSGTGIAHTFINNTSEDVRLLVVGETNIAGAQIKYPLHPDFEKTGNDIWTDAPLLPLGEHDGLPDALRRTQAKP